MIGLGPINAEKIRSITFDCTSWSDIPVRKIIALATVLSKVPLGQGAKTGELLAIQLQGQLTRLGHQLLPDLVCAGMDPICFDVWMDHELLL